MLSSSVSNPSSPPPTSNPVADPHERRPSPVDTVLDFLKTTPVRFAPAPLAARDVARAAVVFDIGTTPPTPALDQRRARRDRLGVLAPAPGRSPRANCRYWTPAVGRALVSRRRELGRALTEGDIRQVLGRRLGPNRDRRLSSRTLLSLAWAAELGSTPHVGGQIVQQQSDLVFLGLSRRAFGGVDQVTPDIAGPGQPDEGVPQGVILVLQPVKSFAQLGQRYCGHSNLSSVWQRGEDAESPKGSPAPSAAKRPLDEGAAQ